MVDFVHIGGPPLSPAASSEAPGDAKAESKSESNSDAAGAGAENISSAAWWHPAVRYQGKDIFGTADNYVKLFREKYNVTPDYAQASSSVSGGSMKRGRRGPCSVNGTSNTGLRVAQEPRANTRSGIMRECQETEATRSTKRAQAARMGTCIPRDGRAIDAQRVGGDARGDDGALGGADVGGRALALRLALRCRRLSSRCSIDRASNRRNERRQRQSKTGMWWC